MYIDSAIFGPRAPALLVDVMGDERVMPGTDAPFRLGEQEAGSLVRGSGLLVASRAGDAPWCQRPFGRCLRTCRRAFARAGSAENTGTTLPPEL